MDFFAGSGTTAQAILEANKQDKGRRQFLCIQLPESCEENSVAAQSKYRTISDIGRERIRRVIEKITAEADFANPVPQDLGVKCFQLTPSNFKQWRGDGIETANVLAEQIEMFVDSVKSGAKTDDLLFELLLKFCQPLTTPIEWLDIKGQRIAAIHNRSLLFILEGFSFEMIEQLLALKPKEIIALDRVFAKSDELQSNLDLACRDVEVKFTCI
jgi:adenine-specific DNA-methyltransferase